MNPLISIVIPTYNRVSDLERALNSVFAQTYPVWEVLVVDNHSDDNTDDFLSGLDEPRIKLLKIHNNGVIAASRNLGINHAVGKYVAFLDSDDWWTPSKLEVSIKYLEQGADIVYHDLYIVKKINQKIFLRKTRARELESPVFNDLMINGNTLSNSSVVVERNILNGINGFSESKSLIAAEDYDGWLRLAKLTNKFKKIPQVLGYYWLGGGNTSTQERTVQVVDEIGSLYANDILNLSKHNNIYYHNYVRGRAYYCMGAFDEAKKYLDQMQYKSLPFSFYIKSCWMLLLIRLRRKKPHK